MRAESRWASLLVFENRTKIAKAEREWMERRVNAALDTQDRICLLQIMTGYGGARFGAVLDGEAAGVTMRLLKHLRRKGGPCWARAMIELFKWTTPVEEKTFALEELPEARRWIDAI